MSSDPPTGLPSVLVSNPSLARIIILGDRGDAARRAIADDLRGAFPDDPNARHADSLVDFVFGGKPPDWRALSVNGEDALFMAHLRSFDTETFERAGRRHVRPLPSIRTVGREFDVVSQLHRTPERLLRAVSALSNLSIEPTKGTAVVATLRNEGISLLEWVAHYRTLGFEQIIIYTNENNDGTDDLLAALSEQGVIRLIQNELAATTPPTQKVYGHAVHLLRELRDYEWAFFVDADEFLLLAPRFEHSIASYLREAEAAAGPELSAVCVHWRWYGSGSAFARTDGLLMERFQEPHNNQHVKTLCRIRHVMSMHQTHVPNLLPGKVAVTSSFRPCSLTPEMPVDYGGAQLNHYWNKSFQEFVLRLMRGDGRVPQDSREKDLQKFFVWGQAPRPPQPVDKAVLANVRAEMTRLRQLPGVVAAASRTEARFKELIEELDRDGRLRSLYVTHMP